MRPIIISPTPRLPNGQVKTVADYQDWRQDLVEAYEDHCAYCGVIVPEKIEVEHIRAKSNLDVDPLEFTNLLLACGRCNNHKSNDPFEPETHVMPTVHNPLCYFDFQDRLKQVTGTPVLVVVPKAGLSEAQRTKAEATISLMKLDLVDDKPVNERRAIDRRSVLRYNKRLLAMQFRSTWDGIGPNDDNIRAEWVEVICQTMKESGFFAVWYKAFEGVPMVLAALRQTLKGTDTTCWDHVGRPLER